MLETPFVPKDIEEAANKMAATIKKDAPIAEVPVVATPVVEPIKEEIKKEEIKAEIKQEVKEEIKTDIANKEKAEQAVVNADLDEEAKKQVEWFSENGKSKKEETVVPEISTEKDLVKEIEKHKSELSEASAKLKEYEDLLENDELVSAFVEYRKAGGSDPDEFSSKLGITNPDKLSTEQLLTEQAKSLGFEGEALTDAVTEEMERFEGLSKMEQKSKINSLKEQFKKNHTEKIKSFSTNIKANSQKIAQIEQSSFKKLDEEAKRYENKKYRGLLVTPEMVNEAKPLAAFYASKKFDEKGNLTGHDVENGMRMAILDKYEKKFAKVNYDIGYTTGMAEAFKERRPNKNEERSTMIPVATETSDERLSAAKKEASEYVWKNR
jgi:hypothetical protein